jgi:glycosyltransferase involved in cell wall biosynthesis
MKLNILLTVHQFLPEYFSGTEILTFGVAKELIRRGHRVSVFTGFPARILIPDNERLDEYKIGEVDVFRFHHSPIPMGDQTVISEIEYNNRLAARYFAKLLLRTKPDIVHFFHLSRLGMGLVDAAAAAAVPAYFTPTDFWSVCPTSQLMLPDGRVCCGPTRYAGNCVKHIASLNPGMRGARRAKYVPNIVADAIIRLTVSDVLPNYPNSFEVAAVGQRKSFNLARLNALHGIVSPTRLMTKVLTTNGVEGRLITQSGYGIDLTGYLSRIRNRREAGVITFGFIGTLAPHKGCHVLIDAFKRIGSDRAKLRIYGNPEDFPIYFDSLQRRSQGIDAIEFCGTFPNDRIAEVLDGLDALVVPSLWYENSPLVILSALAAKCPVIASNFPGMAEVVLDGWNGLIFAPGDVQGLGEKLTRLIDDPMLLELLSTNCVRPHSIEEYVDDLLVLYANRDSAVAGREEIIPGRQTLIPLEQASSQAV